VLDVVILVLPLIRTRLADVLVDGSVLLLGPLEACLSASAEAFVEAGERAEGDVEVL